MFKVSRIVKAIEAHLEKEREISKDTPKVISVCVDTPKFYDDEARNMIAEEDEVLALLDEAVGPKVAFVYFGKVDRVFGDVVFVEPGDVVEKVGEKVKLKTKTPVELLIDPQATLVKGEGESQTFVVAGRLPEGPVTT